MILNQTVTTPGQAEALDDHARERLATDPVFTERVTDLARLLDLVYLSRSIPLQAVALVAHLTGDGVAA